MREHGRTGCTNVNKSKNPEGEHTEHRLAGFFAVMQRQPESRAHVRVCVCDVANYDGRSG